MIRTYSLAPAGSTGNNNHTGVAVNEDQDAMALEFVVSAVGATPTVTAKIQGSFDNTNWHDIAVVPPDSDTLGTTFTVTAVGKTIRFAKDDLGRFWKFVRLVTSANTNVTYNANLHVDSGA